MADERLTKEVFEEKYLPMLNQIGELIINADDVPEDVDTTELLAAVNLVKGELSATFEDRVAEISNLKAENEALRRKNTRLQETNQGLFLKLGSQPQTPPPADPPPKKKGWGEIKSMIDNL